MSAYICSDRHVATIAVRYAELVGAPETAQEIADELLAINIRSVNHLYDEDTPIEPCSLDDVARELGFADLVELCRCLNYQSCELPDYSNPLLERIRAQFEAARALEGDVAESPIWSI